MRVSKNRKGFTLLEILIVLVILGIVAALAIPIYTANINRARGSEAIQKLGAIRSAMQTYYVTRNDSYVNASLDPANANFIGFNPAAVAAGQANSFTYAFVAAPAAATYDVRATCTVGCGPTDTITVDETGDIVGAGIFSGL